MKNETNTLSLFLVALMILMSSCVAFHGSHGKVPPGQMKKATGSQSAKPYAPGQQKKNN